MEHFYKIIDTSMIRGHLGLVIDGIPANWEEWKKHSFLPRAGIVGSLVAEGYVREGLIYILDCAPGIVVPVLFVGLQEISQLEFSKSYQYNKNFSCASNAEIDKAKMSEFSTSLFSQFF